MLILKALYLLYLVIEAYTVWIGVRIIHGLIFFVGWVLALPQTLTALIRLNRWFGNYLDKTLKEIEETKKRL